MDNLITGKHRAKINALQTPSLELMAYAKTLNRHNLGPGDQAIGEWHKAGLPLPDLSAMRRYRLKRVREQLRKLDYAGIILYDPINVRYATDSMNMMVWVMHNACRYAFVPAEGPVVVWEFDKCDFLNAHTEVVDEVRPAITGMYMFAGTRYSEQYDKWAAEIADCVVQSGGGNTRIAMDRATSDAIDALQKRGLSVYNGEEVMELAREIKSEDELKAMRCAIYACERGMDVMREKLVPGVSEQRLWSYLHAENIARGGEWIETRLLASGPRCNPWYQECSSRIIEEGDFMGFDTDLVGAYGICVDISRTWLCGDKPATTEQREIYTLAYEQIKRNTEWLRPGLTYQELTHNSHQYDPNTYRHYTVLYHGVGMCDEAPSIYFPSAWEAFGYDGTLTPGMVICVESYVGKQAGGPGVKLEEQVLITEDGHERLSHYPYETDLLLYNVM